MFYAGQARHTYAGQMRVGAGLTVLTAMILKMRHLEPRGGLAGPKGVGMRMGMRRKMWPLLRSDRRIQS